MNVEFDPIKLKTNKNKHGIDFIDAQVLWDDSDLLEIPVKTTDGARLLLIGKIGEKHWSGIIIYRDENIVIISVRRARNEEIGVNPKTCTTKYEL